MTFVSGDPMSKQRMTLADLDRRKADPDPDRALVESWEPPLPAADDETRGPGPGPDPFAIGDGEPEDHVLFEGDDLDGRTHLPATGDPATDRVMEGLGKQAGPSPVTLDSVESQIEALKKDLATAKAKAIKESPGVKRVLDERKRLFKLRRALKVLDGQTLLPGTED
jgi:hypothetical protein